MTAGVLKAVAAKGCDEFFLNPGSENEEVIAKARSLGLEPIVACSIVTRMRMEPCSGRLFYSSRLRAAPGKPSFAQHRKCNAIFQVRAKHGQEE